MERLWFSAVSIAEMHGQKHPNIKTAVERSCQNAATEEHMIACSSASTSSRVGGNACVSYLCVCSLIVYRLIGHNLVKSLCTNVCTCVWLICNILVLCMCHLCMSCMGHTIMMLSGLESGFCTGDPVCTGECPAETGVAS